MIKSSMMMKLMKILILMRKSIKTKISMMNWKRMKMRRKRKRKRNQHKSSSLSLTRSHRVKQNLSRGKEHLSLNIQPQKNQT